VARRLLAGRWTRPRPWHDVLPTHLSAHFLHSPCAFLSAAPFPSSRSLPSFKPLPFCKATEKTHEWLYTQLHPQAVMIKIHVHHHVKFLSSDSSLPRLRSPERGIKASPCRAQLFSLWAHMSYRRCITEILHFCCASASKTRGSIWALQHMRQCQSRSMGYPSLG
jgi:hypothetical protein